MPAQTSELLTASDGAGTAASFTFAIPAAAAQHYEKFKAGVRVTGGTCDAILRWWTTSSRKFDAGAAITSLSQGTCEATTGPYPNLEISITNNTGTVTADLAYSHPYSGAAGSR